MSNFLKAVFHRFLLGPSCNTLPQLKSIWPILQIVLKLAWTITWDLEKTPCLERLRLKMDLVNTWASKKWKTDILLGGISFNTDTELSAISYWLSSKILMPNVVTFQACTVLLGLVTASTKGHSFAFFIQLFFKYHFLQESWSSKFSKYLT